MYVCMLWTKCQTHFVIPVVASSVTYFKYDCQLTRINVAGWKSKTFIK